MMKATHSQDAFFLKQTVALARKGMRANEGGPFGSVVVKEGRVVGRAWNRVLATCDPTAHAEIEAIRDACRRLRRFHLPDCVIYASCQPCPMCLSAIYWAGIPRVVYANTAAQAAAIGFADKFIYQELNRPMARRKLKAVRMPDADARQLFTEWRAKPDKTSY
jgi:tRNA(Arg) A34 adenosine deaminase TadA